jgi:hypothetical protein
MRLPKILLAFAFLATFGFATPPQTTFTQAVRETQRTAFPVTEDDPWVPFSVQPADSSALFVSMAKLNVGNRILKAWVRIYDFNENLLHQAVWELDRGKDRIRCTYAAQYNLRTGRLTSGDSGASTSWSPIGPNTNPDYLLKLIDELEAYARREPTAKRR